MKWILGTLALLALGLVLQLSLLIYAMYVLLGVLLLSRFFTRVVDGRHRRPAFRRRRSFGNRRQRWRSKSPCKTPARLAVPWLILEDSLLARSADADRRRTSKPRARGWRWRGWPPAKPKCSAYRVKFLMRGYYQLGPLLVETGDVFGLHRRFRVMTEPQLRAGAAQSRCRWKVTICPRAGPSGKSAWPTACLKTRRAWPASAPINKAIR